MFRVDSRSEGVAHAQVERRVAAARFVVVTHRVAGTVLVLDLRIGNVRARTLRQLERETEGPLLSVLVVNRLVVLVN